MVSGSVIKPVPQPHSLPIRERSAEIGSVTASVSRRPSKPTPADRRVRKTRQRFALRQLHVAFVNSGLVEGKAKVQIHDAQLDKHLLHYFQQMDARCIARYHPKIANLCVKVWRPPNDCLELEGRQ